MRIATLAAAALLLAAQAKASTMDMKLEVDGSKGHVQVHIALHNSGSTPLQAPRAIAADKELFGRVFDIVDADTGDAIEYQGSMVKRGPLGPADYVTVKPGGSRKNTIDITHSYAFKPGRHNYRLNYAGTPGEKKPLSAPGVTFSHERH